MTDKPRTLDSRLAALPREATPAPRVWQQIEARIADGSADRSARFEVATAALFAVLTVGVIFGFGELEKMKGPARFAEVEMFEIEGFDRTQLMQVRDNLHGSLRLALDELSPETRITVVENLARIDAARAEIDLALKGDPANQLLKQMLLASYTNEISLLNQFTVMAGSAPQRTQL